MKHITKEMRGVSSSTSCLYAVSELGSVKQSRNGGCLRQPRGDPPFSSLAHHHAESEEGCGFVQNGVQRLTGLGSLGLLGILLCAARARDLSYSCGSLLWLLGELSKSSAERRS